MLDLDFIKENYASMPDEKLIQLAREDKDELIPEALDLLKKEFRSRGLSMNTFETRRETIAVEMEEPIGSYNLTSNADKTLAGMTYQEMMYPSDPEKEKELANEEERKFAKLTREDLKLLIQRSEGAMLKNALIFIAGLVITIISFNSSSERGSFIVAWGAILFGAIGFFRAFVGRNKFISALDQLNENEITSHTND